MLPNNLVLDEVVTPKSLDELLDLASTSYRTEHERTTLESIAVREDGTVQTPTGELRATRNFLEGVARQIGMPLTYAYKLSPELFCENFRQRQAVTTTPITISRVGDVATGLIDDHKSQYKPACTADVLQSIKRTFDLEFRRASVTLGSIDVELIVPGRVVEPVRGDVIEVGVSIKNSEAGEGHLLARAYSYRLVCTNGAVMSSTAGLARWPNDPRMTYPGCLRAFEKSLAGLCDRLEPVKEMYLASVERRIPDDHFWNLWRRLAYLMSRSEADEALNVTERERQDLQQTIRLREPTVPAILTEHSAYDIHNRVTHAAHGRPLGARRALQELGGDLLSRAASWPSAPSMN